MPAGGGLRAGSGVSAGSLEGGSGQWPNRACQRAGARARTGTGVPARAAGARSAPRTRTHAHSVLCWRRECIGMGYTCRSEQYQKAVNIPIVGLLLILSRHPPTHTLVSFLAVEKGLLHFLYCCFIKDTINSLHDFICLS